LIAAWFACDNGEEHRVHVLLVAMLILLPAWCNAAEISGHIDLSAEGKALRAEEAQDAIVYFRPKVPPAVAPVTQIPVMGTRRKQFVPRVLAVTVGSQVRFPNEDPILHNAFSTSKDNSFDVGLYGQGDGQIVTFSHVGYVRVYCNVHHSMMGHILVLDTPYFTHPDANGDFHLANVPSVEGDLVVWQDRATPWHTVITAGAAGKPLVVPLELSQRRVPAHMNKFGKPYGRSSDGGY
jgi:plastocyanin